VKVITLQRPAVCKSCGATIPAGASARYYSADAIYCETHQKDSQGKEIPNFTGSAAQPPLAVPAAPPRALSITHQDFVDLQTEMVDLKQVIKWTGEKVALATDFLNTLCILLRQNQEAYNAKTIKSSKTSK